MDRRERLLPEAIARSVAVRAALDGRAAEIWTAMPGLVDSIDNLEDQGTIDVRLTIMSKVEQEKGKIVDTEIAILPDVLVYTMGGGGCSVTFPISVGDECLVIFASRCYNNWWFSGGVQEQEEVRLHDLSDGIALVGLRSLPRWLSGYSLTSAQLRSDDGKTVVDLNGGTSTITMKANTINLQAGSLIQMTAPTIKEN